VRPLFAVIAGEMETAYRQAQAAGLSQFARGATPVSSGNPS
jgi:hypothetical protein